VGEALIKAGRAPEEASRTGFILVAAVFAAAGTAAFQMAGLFTREKIAPSQKENNMRENLKMMWRNKPFRQVLVSGVLAGPRNITNIVAFTLVTYYFAGKDGGKAMIYLVLVGGGLFAGMLGSTALVPKMLERMTKRNLFLASNFLEVVPDMVLFGLYLLSLKMEGGLTSVPMMVLMMVLFTVKGVSLGTFSTVQTNMVADAVDFEDYTNHVRPDGVFFSGQTFLAKISNGISQLIYAGLCGLVMFSGKNVQLMQGLLDNALADPSQLPRNVMQFGSQAVVYTGALGSLTADQVFWCITMMFFGITIIPAVFSVLAALPMFKYCLSPEKYEEVLTALQERRRAEGEVTEGA
ncbi:MAG: MFS transporter, partial [Firmicutes bacterium]|nr:MFS transporter [Bacillota bacterium]